MAVAVVAAVVVVVVLVAALVKINGGTVAESVGLVLTTINSSFLSPLPTMGSSSGDERWRLPVTAATTISRLQAAATLDAMMIRLLDASHHTYCTGTSSPLM